MRRTSADSAQHHLHLPGIAVEALGEVHGLGTRHDGPQVDDATLGLGDDLLRHDQHVALCRRQRRVLLGESPPGGDDHAAEVVARLDLGQLGQRHGERSPARPLTYPGS